MTVISVYHPFGGHLQRQDSVLSGLILVAAFVDFVVVGGDLYTRQPVYPGQHRQGSEKSFIQ